MSGLLSAQEIAPGTWRTHFSYRNALILEETATKIYCATQNGLFYTDQQDLTVNKLTTLDGLSDVGISALGYSPDRNVLVIGYKNGNIDILSESGITNIDVVLEQNLIQDKKISSVSFFNDQAFLSTDFGIVVIDLQRQLLEEVYREIGPSGQQPEVSATFAINDSLYAITSTGFLSAPLLTGSNLLDFNNWQQLSTPEMLFHLAGNNSQLVVAGNNTVYTYRNGVFTTISGNFENIESIAIEKEQVISVIDSGKGYIYDEIRFNEIENEGSETLSDIIVSDNTFWLADREEGLKKLSSGSFQSIIPDGPFSDQIQSLVFQDTALFAFGPYRTGSYQPLSRGGYSVFNNGSWQELVFSAIENSNQISDNFLLTFNSGLYSRSNLQRINDVPFLSDQQTGQILLTDMTETSEALWVTNFGSEVPLHKLDNNNLWTSFDLNGRAENITEIAVSRFVWIRSDDNSGVTVLDAESGNVQVVNQNNSDLPSSAINDLTIDLDDELWVATNAGVAFFPSASTEFSDFNTAIRPIFENNFLFRDEIINCITVDPGNRKWIGTRTGAWLLEEGGERLVRRFTKENSPLPSDNVQEIAINPMSGETFFVTEKGMVSYRSDASASSEIHSNVKIFPNPVRPGFSGLVGFSGFATDVRLKITDVSGKLIRELEANGGGAAWNLRDINGSRAQTGIYLVFSADRNGVETYVGKLAIVN